MFDFEKLEVYTQMRSLNTDVLKYLFSTPELDRYLREQLIKATVRAATQLAEGVGQMNDVEKKQYYIMSRSSIFECVALLQMLSDSGQLDPNTYKVLYEKYETVSKMLLGFYRSKN